MKIGYLGAGTWGTALASLLSQNGHQVKVWDRDSTLLRLLDKKRTHPKLEGSVIPSSIRYVDTIDEAILDAEIIIESVTSKGIRSILMEIKKRFPNVSCPIVFTSKGIEQHSGLLFPEIALEILGEENRERIGCLSGPSHAEEVIKHIPTSVVCAAFDKELMILIANIFNSPNFRVYPNSDILGVSFGGAMKNIIAIACAISDGLKFGDNTRAAIMTRGLHEIRKLAAAKGCNEQTLNGLSGLGDLFVTCSSTLSRNYKFGMLIAKGYDIEEAIKEVGMVVEGVYTCVSARELGEKYKVPLPITEATYKILYEELQASEAVSALLGRAIKEEHL